MHQIGVKSQENAGSKLITTAVTRNATNVQLKRTMQLTQIVVVPSLVERLGEFTFSPYAGNITAAGTKRERIIAVTGSIILITQYLVAAITKNIY